MQSQAQEKTIEGVSFPVCESTLMPVSDEYTYIHHNSIQVGVFKYIEKAP
ncbi:MAG: hypothetical protein QW470_00140 [Candidatus Caldarchaeum sp.]